MTEEQANVTTEDNGRRKPTKAEILKAFKADLRSADTLRQEAFTAVEGWRKEYNGEKYGNEVKGKSSIVSRDIKRQDEWQHASVKDPFVSDQDIIKCNPVTFEDKKAAEQNELVLNYQFARQFNRYKFMTDAIKLYYAEGTVIAKTGWNYEDEVVTVDMPVMATHPYTNQPVQVATKKIKKLNILKNQPDAQLCRIQDVYLDPTAEGDVKKAQFIIHRYESDLSSLRKSKKYKNLKKLAMSMARESGDDFDPTDDTEFMFTDNARKKLVVYEYWGNFDINGTGIAEPVVCTWVNDVIIQLTSNPMPDKELPFLVVANNSTPFKLHGEANAELIGDNQKINTAIKRGILDNMANSNNAQKGLRVGALDVLNTKRFLNGKNFVFNGSAADFYEGSYNQIPGSVFQVLEMINNETESMLGVKGFAGGVNAQGLGSTATAARGALDAVSVRRLDIIRNLSENLLKPLMRKWMAYNGEFLRPEEIIRITNDEFIPIKRDDLKGLVDIVIHVSTAEDNAAKAQELAFMMQTGQQTMDPQETRMIRAEIARLQKMPELAKQIEEYQPQPDPLAQRMRELEIEKVEVEIEERRSRANENYVDIRAKNAKAALDEARVREINSSTDLKDQEFTRKAEGADFNEEMAKKEHDRTTQAGLKQMDKKSESK